MKSYFKQKKKHAIHPLISFHSFKIKQKRNSFQKHHLRQHSGILMSNLHSLKILDVQCRFKWIGKQKGKVSQTTSILSQKIEIQRKSSKLKKK